MPLCCQLHHICLKQAARLELASEDYETSMLAIAPHLHFGGGAGVVRVSVPEGYLLIRGLSSRREDPRHNASLTGNERRSKEKVRCPLF